MASTPRAVRSRSRSKSISKSPQLLRKSSRVRLVGDLAADYEDPTPPSTPKAAGDTPRAGSGAPLSPRRPRSFNPITAGKRMLRPAPRRVLRAAQPEERSMFGRYLNQILPGKLSRILSAAAVVLAAVLFYGELDGPKLIKRDASLRPGDRMLGGQYITTCTSLIATGCKPKYFEVGRDGSVAIYAGRGPSSSKLQLWSANTGSKNSAHASYDLMYSSGKIMLHKDGKMKWSTSVKSLPKNMQPWPFAP